MKMPLRSLIAILSLGLVGCNSKEVIALEFCPPEIETEARETLGLKSKDSVSLSELLAKAEELGLSFESYKHDNKPLHCKAEDLGNNYISYMIYGGFNETKEYKKAYLVIGESLESDVLYIDKRYMYKAPNPF